MRYPYTDPRTGVTYLGGTETPGVIRYRMRRGRRRAFWSLLACAVVVVLSVLGLAAGHLHGWPAQLRVVNVAASSVGAVFSAASLWRYRKARWPQ